MLLAGTALLAGVAAAAFAVLGHSQQQAPGHTEALGAATLSLSAGDLSTSLTSATLMATNDWLAQSVAGRSQSGPVAKSRHGARSSPKPAPTASQTPAQSAPPVYLNPLRAVTGLIPQRIDMGADFAGTGPIYAIGDAIITNATATSPGWPGGGWITYQLTDGPAAGLQVYDAEDVTPTVTVGEHVTASTVIANMYDGGAGIETGWAMPDGSSAESQLSVAGGISGGGPFPTAVGVSFDDLLQALGAPAAPNAGQAPYGLLPSNYPTNWSSLSSASS